MTATRKIQTGKIQTFVRLLREMQKIDAEFPLQYALCLAEISLEQGLSLTELSARTGLSLSTTSRIVGALSKKRQKGVPYNLVKVKVSAAERRRKELYLTSRGHAVIGGIDDIL
jgi:DNA-binding MarR family transcriptional regulator